MEKEPEQIPPFAAIARLVDHFLMMDEQTRRETTREWNASTDKWKYRVVELPFNVFERRLQEVITAAYEVEEWLIANRMTPESEDL
jgi:hypothetical protein